MNSSQFLKIAMVGGSFLGMTPALQAGFDDGKFMEIEQYVRQPGPPTFVLRNVGAIQLGVGQLLETQRLPKNRRGIPGIKTGELKVVSIGDHRVVAMVVQDGTALSKSIFPKFPGVMVGDLVRPKAIEIVRNQAVVPEKHTSYYDLFLDPKANPMSFELSEEGKQRIRDLGHEFGWARLPVLMVEGHTDHHGPSEMNQVESYQRALAVRQFLIDEMGFDGERVVALGFGESETPDQDLVPGYTRAHRRIVFKVPAMDDDD